MQAYTFNSSMMMEMCMCSMCMMMCAQKCDSTCFISD